MIIDAIVGDMEEKSFDAAKIQRKTKQTLKIKSTANGLRHPNLENRGAFGLFAVLHL